MGDKWWCNLNEICHTIYNGNSGKHTQRVVWLGPCWNTPHWRTGANSGVLKKSRALQLYHSVVFKSNYVIQSSSKLIWWDYKQSILTDGWSIKRWRQLVNWWMDMHQRTEQIWFNEKLFTRSIVHRIRCICDGSSQKAPNNHTFKHIFVIQSLIHCVGTHF